MAIKVAIVEDVQDFAESVKETLAAYPDIKWLGSFPRAEDFIEGFHEGFRPDVVLMDFDFRETKGKISGIDCIKELKEKYPRADTEYVMFTTFQSPEVVFAALKAGAVGFVTKADSQEKLINAIQLAEVGGGYMSIPIARLVMEYFNHQEKTKSMIYSGKGLTDGEIEVLELIAKGYSHKEIAKEINRSVDAVRSRIKNIFSKLEIHSKAEAILLMKGEARIHTNLCEGCPYKTP